MNAQVIDQKNALSSLLNTSLKVFFKNAFRVSWATPRQALFFIKTARRQIKAARVRSGWEARGIEVPPILIFSVTERCNLRCTGCYARALQHVPDREMRATRGVFQHFRDSDP